MAAQCAAPQTPAATMPAAPAPIALQPAAAAPEPTLKPAAPTAVPGAAPATKAPAAGAGGAAILAKLRAQRATKAGGGGGGAARREVVVLHASQLGTAMEIAKNIGAEAERRGLHSKVRRRQGSPREAASPGPALAPPGRLPCTGQQLSAQRPPRSSANRPTSPPPPSPPSPRRQVASMDEFGFDAVRAATCPALILVASSTGDGDPPDNSARFYGAARRRAHPDGLLQGVKASPPPTHSHRPAGCPGRLAIGWAGPSGREEARGATCAPPTCPRGLRRGSPRSPAGCARLFLHRLPTLLRPACPPPPPIAAVHLPGSG